MISGAGEGTRVSGGNCRTGTTAVELFREFEALYQGVQTIETHTDFPVVKISIPLEHQQWGQKNRVLRLSHRNFGPQMEAYSRTARLHDGTGEWVTVQIRQWTGSLFTHVALDVFGEEGEVLNSIRDSDCEGRLEIPWYYREWGEDVLIQMALLAVTGKTYPLVFSKE